MKLKKLLILIHFLLIVSSILIATPNSLCKYVNERGVVKNNSSQKTQLSFAAFSDTHIGSNYEFPWYYRNADYLDKLGWDLVDNTNLLDFAVNLGDIINRNTGHVNGVRLPWYVNQYKNNLKAYHISRINLPFHCVIGNHDVNDYEMNNDDPHNLTKSLVNELSMNNPVYAMMRDGILFLVVPELGYVQWTHPVEYEWIEYMTSKYSNTTTVILSHQAIEDTTYEETSEPYRGKQDMDWWANLFQNNSQIKMWINGHNHYLDWYIDNQTSGETQDKIWQFGHQMVFSAPYSQLDWAFRHEEDRIVIYNITSTDITTATWEYKRRGGNWVSDYINSWDVSTTFDPEAEDWYSFPMFLQDNETQLTDMKVLSPNIKVQLIGTVPMELFYDSYMESPSSKDYVKEIILGFGNDRDGNVVWTNPGMKVYGPTYVTFPDKYPFDKRYQEDGRSGQPYHSFPMGTICAAVPGQTYNFTITARCASGSGKFNMTVNCSDWGTKSQYSVLSGSENQVFSHMFGPDYETIYGTYKVPDDENAWFLQGRLDFLNSVDYDITLFSVKRERSSDTTDDFHLCLSGTWYNVSGTLNENEMVDFAANPQLLANYSGVMNFTAYIDGNRYGMVNVIYREPIILSRNARFRVNEYSKGVFNLSLTTTISRSSPVNMKVWNSELFQKFPIVTELIYRFILKSYVAQIFLNKISLNESVTFKMLPYSTDPIYEHVEINADDGSGMKHISDNGNLWFSCNCPQNGERYVEVYIPEK